MYPWVNRLQKEQSLYQPVFKDGNGLPLHGVAVNTPVNISEERVGSKVVIKVTPLPENKVPKFSQIYTIS